MFYSQFILAKKGPLGTIWIAAHLERKLRKNQVTETNISVSVDSILFPEVPIALRLSGHLLLGVVRIYSRKVNYLFHDCSEALTKIKQAFHSGAVDLPPDAATAPFHSITIPENFDLDELEPLPERESNALFTSHSADHHVTSREQITLRDPLGDDVYLASFDLDERFPEGDAEKLGIDDEEELLNKPYEREQSPVTTLEEDQLAPMPEDEELDFDRMDVDANENDPASPTVVKDRADEDELFGHSIEMQPMLEDERLEPSSLAGDDDMDSERLHQSPGTSPIRVVELPAAQDGEEEGVRNQSELPDEEMSAHGNTPNLTDTVEAQGIEDKQLEAIKENEGTFGGVASIGADMGQGDEHGRDADGLVMRDEESVAEEAECANPQDTVVSVHEEDAEPLHGESNEVRATNSVDGLHANGAPETLQELDQQPHKDDAVSTAQNVHVHARDEDADDVISSPKDGQRSPHEVPEYEVVRSVVDTVEKEPDMFEMDKGSPSELIAEQQHGAEKLDEIMEDVVLVVSEHDNVMEGAMVVRESSSPPLASPGNEHDVPEDNEALAELLGGRGTPALGVVPTPLAAIAPKTVKPRVSKKRKAVFDLFDLRTVIQAEAMRDQLVNTADIRRVRKKAPCTRREFWLLQRELQANNSFHDPSVPGLCPELRDLFHRVCVFGEASLPRPGMHDISLNKEKTPELDLENEDIENDFHSSGHAPAAGVMEAITPDENGHEDSHQEAQHEISPEQPHQTANASDGNDWAESPENDTAMEDQDTMLNETGQDGVMVFHGPENEAEVGAAEEAVDEDEAARQAAREAVLLEWEAFDNASLEQESLKQVEQQLELQPQGTEVCTAHADARGPVVQEADTPQEAEQMPVRSEDIETEPYFPPTDANLETQSYQQDVSQGGLVAEAQVNEAHQEIEDVQSVPDLHAGAADSVIQVIRAEVETDAVGDNTIVQDTNKINPQPEISYREEHKMSDQGHDEGDSPQDVGDHHAQLEIGGDVSAVSSDPDATSHEVPQGGSSLENGDPISKDSYLNGAIHASPEDWNNREDLGFLADAQETVYRTGDDGDLEMDADEYVDTRDYNQDEPLVQDNSGWSVRTRAVGRYLKTTLDAMEMKLNRVEGIPSAPVKLGLERTLAGKTRKEAARMFFETLVLKTKDYINVEQAEPYEDIKVSAGPKLRKATF